MLQDENSKIRGELEAVKEKCKKMQQILKNAEGIAFQRNLSTYLLMKFKEPS